MPVADLDVHIVGLVRGVVVVASEGEVEVPFGSHADGTALDPREVQARIAFRVGVLGEFLYPVVPCALVDVQPFAEVVRFVRFHRLDEFLELLDVLLERVQRLVGGVLGVVHGERHVEGVGVEHVGIYYLVPGLRVRAAAAGIGYQTLMKQMLEAAPV